MKEQGTLLVFNLEHFTEGVCCVESTLLIDGTTWRRIHTLDGAYRAISLDGKVIVTAGNLVWDTNHGALINRLTSLGPNALTSDGAVLAGFGGPDGNLGLWDTRSGEMLFLAETPLPGVELGVVVLTFSEDDRMLLTAGSDGVVGIWGVVPWNDGE